MNRDTIIGIVGAVILVAAMVGVFQYERSRAPVASEGDFELTNSTLDEVTGATVIAAEDTVTIQVNQTNLTHVHFVLSWSPVVQNFQDTLSITVTPPAGFNATENLTAEGASGTLELAIPIPNAEPTNAPLTLGTGEWTVVVKYVSSTAPVSQVPLPQTQTVQWSLATTVTHYEPAA